MSLKYIPYIELWQALCSVERNHFAIFVEGIMRNNIELGPVVQEEMSFNDVSYLEL